jgi:DNA-binding SARP family transcriptional activator
LAYIFWPRASESSARRNLRQYLFRLRKVLEPIDPEGDLLEVDGSQIRLNPQIPITTDVAKFERCLRTDAAIDDLYHALTLYRGDLLEELYDEWCVEPRARLRRAYLVALKRLTLQLQAEGCIEEAILYVEKFIGEEPLDEEAHRLRMTLVSSAGDRTRALAHYQDLKTLLQVELQTEPSPETNALAQAIQHGTQIRHETPTPTDQRHILPSPADRSQFPLVGRESELARILELAKAAVQGNGAWILISGESGVGKTRLLEEYLGLQAPGLKLSTACHELEAMLPYASLRHLLEQAFSHWPVNEASQQPAWLPSLAGIVPALRAKFPFLPAWGTGLEAQVRLTAAYNQLILGLAEQAENRPIHWILDDLHWADNPTWEFLGRVTVQMQSMPLLIIGLCRLEDLPAGREKLIERLERNGHISHLKLEDLTIEQTAELTSRVRRGDPPDSLLLQRLYQETGGNPLFIIETVRALDEGQRLPTLPISSGSRPILKVPLSIQRVIEARLDRLHPDSRELLATASLIGRPFYADLLQTITEHASEEIVAWIEEWTQRGLIRETDGCYTFTHERIREVAQSGMSQARIQSLYRRIGEVFARLFPPADDATLAFYFSRSDQPLLALAHFARAGEQALNMRSYQEAHQFGLRAINLLSRMPSSNHRAQRIDLNLQLAQAYAFTGELSQALEILNKTEEMASVEDERERLGKVYHRSSQYFWLLGRPNVAGDYARRALRIAEACDNEALEQGALRMLGRVSIALSAFDDAIAYFQRYVGESETALAFRLAAIHGYLGVAYSRVGAWESAYQAAQKGLDLALAEGAPQTIEFASMQLAFIHADQQDWAGCLHTIDSTDIPAKPDDQLAPHEFMLYSLRGRALAHLGEASTGVALIRSALAWSERSGYRVFDYLPQLFLAEALELGGHSSEAARVGEQALEKAVDRGNRWASAITRRTLADIETHQPSPNWERIESLLIESMQTLRQVRARPDLARTYLELRRLYDRVGQAAWAVDCHFRGTVIYEELGMTAELQRALGKAAGDRLGAEVISQVKLRGPNDPGP